MSIALREDDTVSLVVELPAARRRPRIDRFDLLGTGAMIYEPPTDRAVK